MNEMILKNVDFVQRVADAVFSEYGAFVAFLMTSIVVLYRSREQSTKRNDELTDKILDTIGNNTEALSKMISKIDDSYHVKSKAKIEKDSNV